MRHWLTGLLAYGCLGSPVFAQILTYQLGMPEPSSHYFEVSLRIEQAPKQPLKLVMPVWTPGSYLVREFARQVQGMEAMDRDGQILASIKVNKNTWQIAPTDTGVVTVKYRVYANELSVRTSYLGADYGFFNGANIFPYLEGYKDKPITLVVQPAPAWSNIVTGLPKVTDQKNTFRADNYDLLVDAPTVIGNVETYSFTVRNIPHRLVVAGQANYDPNRLVKDTERIVVEQTNFFNDIPYRDYSFLMFLVPGNGAGGLEHLNSTALTVGLDRFQPDKSYRGVLGLISHEFFHLWNVKRIRPLGLGPFDYTQEVYTTSLWIAEGTTNYYDDLFLRRAGLMTSEQYLQTIADQIKTYDQTPGRKVQSLAQSSFDAWIKYYRPDENSVNSSVSYYDKGSLVSFVLDMEIRKITKNARSLDDVFQLLNRQFGQPGQPGYTPAEFEKIAAEIAGVDLTGFFRKNLYGTEDIDLVGALAVAGLQLKTELSKLEDDTKPRAYLGLEIRNETGPALITNVLLETPAARAGLSPGDELIAINSYKVDATNYRKKIGQYAPGATVQITLARGQRLQTLPVILGTQPNDVYKITPVSQPTAQQKAIYESWLKDKWKR